MSRTRLAILGLMLAFIAGLSLASVTIQSGQQNGNYAGVDATSNALRVTQYDSRGNASGQKVTYSAATTAKTATAAGTAPWFTICGSSTKTIRVEDFVAAPTVATAAVYADIELIKTSTATSGGTPVALTKVPHDSTSAAATASIVNFYSALATAGAAVGPVASRQVFAPITATITLESPTDVSLLSHTEAEAIVLRGTAQCLEASFGTTTTNVPTLTVEVTWTEE